MSYFSHNPEQWDDITNKALAEWMQREGCDWDTPELVEYVAEMMDEQPELYDRLIRSIPLDIITAQEQDFWGDRADAYLAVGD